VQNGKKEFGTDGLTIGGESARSPTNSFRLFQRVRGGGSSVNLADKILMRPVGAERLGGSSTRSGTLAGTADLARKKRLAGAPTA
jgi:hypothetical protein